MGIRSFPVSCRSKHSVDDECGGYFTCLDEDGSVYDETKYAWLQGRQVYMLSRLYNEARASAEARASWLRAAANGVKFLDHARDPETGLLFFSTTRDGSARLHLQRKPYAGVFYVQGMLEFWRALQTHKREGSPCPDIVPLEAQSDEFLAKAHATFKDLDAWIRDPSLCGRPAVPPEARDDKETRLADVMCMASLSLDFLKAGATSEEGGREYYLGLIREAMVNCERHYDIRHGGPPGVLLELCSGGGLSSDSPAGRLFSPGHSIEVAWFLLMMCDAVGGSPKHEKLALDALEGSIRRGWDEECGGGLLYAIDVEGRPLLDATVTSDGKLWWPHTEALIALTMAATRTGEEKWLIRSKRCTSTPTRLLLTAKSQARRRESGRVVWLLQQRRIVGEVLRGRELQGMLSCAARAPHVCSWCRSIQAATVLMLCRV